MKHLNCGFTEPSVLPGNTLELTSRGTPSDVTTTQGFTRHSGIQSQTTSRGKDSTTPGSVSNSYSPVPKTSGSSDFLVAMVTPASPRWFRISGWLAARTAELTYDPPLRHNTSNSRSPRTGPSSRSTPTDNQEPERQMFLFSEVTVQWHRRQPGHTWPTCRTASWNRRQDHDLDRSGKHAHLAKIEANTSPWMKEPQEQLPTSPYR